ncbi:hypothetical protein HDK77DRAFT_291959 [Phyllosticta capitalensis]
MSRPRAICITETGFSTLLDSAPAPLLTPRDAGRARGEAKGNHPSTLTLLSPDRARSSRASFCWTNRLSLEKFESKRKTPRGSLSAAIGRRSIPSARRRLPLRHVRLSQPLNDAHSTVFQPLGPPAPSAGDSTPRQRSNPNTMRCGPPGFLCGSLCLRRLAVGQNDWIVSRATNAWMRQPRHCSRWTVTVALTDGRTCATRAERRDGLW